MMRTTSDPAFARMVQRFLEDEGLYQGEPDGVWGPKSDLACQQYLNFERYEAIADYQQRLSPAQMADLAKFLKVWKDPASHSLYGAVGKACDIPAALVAALHWRECGGDFGCYLHNGDPMKDAAGQAIPTVHVPAGILFNSWTTAACDAIERETAAFTMSGIEEWADTRATLSALCVFAEYYNGEGYRERGVPDPYVLAGTTGYTKGKFTADGTYDPEAVDEQVGVLVLLRAVIPSA